MNFLEKEIEDPREIRNISEEVLERAEELGDDEELYVGLDHNHYSIIRGRNEEARGIDLKVDLDVDYPVEVHRNDAGDSWVHSTESYCIEKVSLIEPGESKSHEKLMGQWARELEEKIEAYADQYGLDNLDPVHDSGDIYNSETGKQIGGLSLEVHGNKVLQRLCFYEEDHFNENRGPDMEEHRGFHRLIETDMDAAESDLNDPRKDYEPLPGLYRYLMDDLMESEPGDLSISGELTAGEEVENSRQATYCISRRPS